MLRGFQMQNSNDRGMVGLIAATSKQRRSKKQKKVWKWIHLLTQQETA
jgi:hypothetical protein